MPEENCGYPVKRYSCKAKRFCQTLDLKDDPELMRAYRQLHSKEQVWPEILEGIKKAGVLEMEIYELGTRLFMIVEMPEDLHWNEVMSRMGSMPCQKEWEQLTAHYQVAATDAKSEEKWKMMSRIFHLYDIESK